MCTVYCSLNCLLCFLQNEKYQTLSSLIAIRLVYTSHRAYNKVKTRKILLEVAPTILATFLAYRGKLSAVTYLVLNLGLLFNHCRPSQLLLPNSCDREL